MNAGRGENGEDDALSAEKGTSADGSPKTAVTPRVLTVAGSDSGGGAGIQADLKTFQELGVFGMSAITAVTAQNSRGIQAVYPLPAAAIEAQLESVLGDIGADAVKTGMLLGPAVVRAAAGAIRKHGIGHVVVDPVLSAKDGSELLRREAVEAMRRELFPLAEVITPNVPEACELLGLPALSIGGLGDMIAAARELLRLGPRYVLLKGGHLPGEAAPGEAVDVLVGGGEACEPRLLRSPRYPTRHTHGTGCTTASALAAYLALGHTPESAAAEAKRFVAAAIAAAVPLGAGIGSLWHAAHRTTGARSDTL